MSSVVSGFLASAFLALCEDTDTPRSLTAAMLFEASEWDQLVSLECNPKDYSSSDAYFVDKVVTDFFRKTKNLPTTFDRKAKALENFYKCEQGCYATNERLSPFLYGSLADPRDERIAVFLRAVRKEASSILGSCPQELRGRFGPGATFSDRGVCATVPHKMSSHPSLTSSAWPFLLPWSGLAWATACATDGKAPSFVKGNRFTTVPKDCKKDRGIAVEPSINLFYQLGAGLAIRSRLRRVGIDLTCAQEVHKQVARDASIEGYLCTEDLSNASDTISTNLVRLVLPTAWFELLDSLRSPYTKVEGKWLKLEKFSSMGNGYTFELETVIYISVISAVMKSNGVEPLMGVNLYVFGDDIIFPAHLSQEVNAVLKFLGMTVNEAKSFVSGPFRESCGGDFFNGVDVRPFHLKELPCEPQHFITVANGLRRLGSYDSASHLLDPRFRRAWFRILDALPSAIRRLRGPERLGDLVIHDDREHWQIRWRRGIRYIRVYRPARFRTVPWRVFRPEVILASAVYGVGDGERGVMPRDAVAGYKVGWTSLPCHSLPSSARRKADVLRWRKGLIALEVKEALSVKDLVLRSTGATV